MRPAKSFLLFLVFIMIVGISDIIFGCTTAIIGREVSKDGIPVLWKNRDTGHLSNKIIYVDEKPYSFIGIVNASENSGRFVYAGLNIEGFGIINTVAYNLPKNENEVHDLEGQIMSDALRTCKSANDFEKYLIKNLGRSLGSWSTYGVIDAEGNSTLFEVHNNGYKRFNTSETEDKYFVVTNFARSGQTGKGEGYLRFERASELFKKFLSSGIGHEDIFRYISRDIGNVLVNHPSLSELKNHSSEEPFWIYSRDSINRPLTSAAIVIAGKNLGEKNSVATFWVILGEPVTSIAVPVWVEAGSTPTELFKGDTAPICFESFRIKRMIHPFSEGSKKNYLNTSKLINKEGSGFLTILQKVEKEISNETNLFLLKSHVSEEFALFQEKMAKKALNALKNIK